jgi:Delta6-protoilludene synthase
MLGTPPRTVVDQTALPLKASEPQIIRIPDLLARWPLPRMVNAHYEECKRESTAWIEGFCAFSPKAQTAFNKCNLSMLQPLLF